MKSTNENEAAKNVQEAPPSQWDALKSFGYWQTVDAIMLMAVVVTWVTILYWTVFTPELDTIKFIAYLLIAIALKLIWLIILVFRCSYFILMAHADINLMPAAAARMAAAFMMGSNPLSPKK